VLDRIDEIVTPGTLINPVECRWIPEARGERQIEGDPPLPRRNAALQLRSTRRIARSACHRFDAGRCALSA
jgi:hypothetical protein